MREDNLWSPLQSACSMQHLRSVPSPGRQCSPDPTLLTCPANATLISSKLPSIFPSPPPRPINLPCRYPQGRVGTPVHALSSPASMTCKSPMTVTPLCPAAWCAHTQSQTPANRKKATEETSNQNITGQPD